MKIHSIFPITRPLFASVSVVSPQATKPATDAPPRRGQQPPPLVSPELLPDGGVTFRLRATKANEVKVAGQFGTDAPMIKETQNGWSVTVPPGPAGVDECHLLLHV